MQISWFYKNFSKYFCDPPFLAPFKSKFGFKKKKKKMLLRLVRPTGAPYETGRSMTREMKTFHDGWWSSTWFQLDTLVRACGRDESPFFFVFLLLRVHFLWSDRRAIARGHVCHLHKQVMKCVEIIHLRLKYLSNLNLFITKRWILRRCTTLLLSARRSDEPLDRKR